MKNDGDLRKGIDSENWEKRMNSIILKGTDWWLIMFVKSEGKGSAKSES